MARRIAILGSTGSIGKNALQVLEGLGSGYEVAALSAHTSAELLSEQARRYRPRYVAVTEPSRAGLLCDLVKGLDVEVLAGPDSLVELAGLADIDVVLTAVVGAAGLPAVLAAAEKGKTIAIANKEPLVVAGELLTRTAGEHGARIIPVDSEHSAIFQALQAGRADEVARVILTSSGGPFRGLAGRQLESATVEQVMAHPVWEMGPKITVDSATMMNKALEVIEAHWLFSVPVEQIEVLIHPESIVHSLVEFVDGSVLAQMSRPDMRIPIQYALTYPRRLPGRSERLRLEDIGKLTFEEPDVETFPAVAMGYEVARAGGTAPSVFNAANEVAVEEFLAGRIKFVNIVEIIRRCLDEHDVKGEPDLEALLEADGWARRQVRELVHSLQR